MDVCETGGGVRRREKGERTKEPNRPACPGQNSSGTVVVRAKSVLDRAHESSDASCLDSHSRCVAEGGSRLEGFRWYERDVRRV